jgi:alkylhydroperoxidase family enzyme
MPAPRIPPVELATASQQVREVLARHDNDGRIFNIFRTLAHHPDLLRRWSVFANHVLAKSTLPARERELVILRTGWLCGSEYEWGQHARIGRGAGLREEEIRRIADGPGAGGWSETDALLLRAADELHASQKVGDATWQRLSESFTTQQMLDLVFAIGQYTLVCMVLRSAGVELDEGVATFEETAGRRPSSA